MRILFIAHFAGSPKHGMVFGHYHLARTWVEAGHDVTIAAAGFAHTRYRQPEIAEETIDGIHYKWLKTPRYTPGSRFGRVLNIVAFTCKSFLHLRSIERADIVICSSHHPLAIYPSAYLARKWGARLVFEVRDLWPLTLIELGGASRQNPFIALLQTAENFAYRTADRVVSVLPYAEQYMLEHGLGPGKFIYIPNGIDLAPGELPQPLEAASAKLLIRFKQRHRLVVGYAGRIGIANALESAILALRQLPDVGFAILGHGPEKARLEHLCVEQGLTHQVLFLDPVNRTQVGSFLESVDVAYLGLQSKTVFRFGVSPTKLNDYMLAGKPIICAVASRIDAVNASGCGIVCNPEVDAIQSALRCLTNMTPADLALLGQQGRKWLVENRDYRKLGQAFLSSVTDP